VISPFFLHKPSTLEEASSILAEHGEEAKILAGGSDLVLLFKMGLARAKHVVDLKGLGGLDRVEFDSKRKVLRVGALVTHRMLETSSAVREYYPIFAAMERQVANVRVRNVGTLGGNLCFAEPHADPGTLLLAYQAEVKARSRSGERTLRIDDFFVDYYQTDLREDEILTEVEIPLLGDNFCGTYRRFCPGERLTVGMALLIEWQDRICRDVRLALGCVGPRPIRAREVEEALRGKPAEEISAKALEAGERAASLVDPPPDVWGSTDYKRQIVKVLVSRGLQDLCRRRTLHG
jgi:carbon-monoxide dehydrogenase medium subunit